MDVQTVVTVRNTGDKTTQINTNICGHPISAFTTPERNGNPVWQSYDPTIIQCFGAVILATLAPGDYYDFRLTGTIPPTLPSGVYYLAVDINGKRVPAGQFSK
jgi:hypothetical protein